MPISRSLYIVAVVAIVAIAAYGISYNIANAELHEKNVPTSDVYSMTLVITTNNIFNQTVGDQPAFYVLNNGTLQSSALINMPANEQISLTIINYDDGPAPVPSQYSSVVGTTGNTVNIINDTNVNSSQTSNGISLTGGATVSSVNDTNIAHTFTVFSSSNSVLVNIPIPPSSVVHASFVLGSGSYTWQCEAACGSGSSGWGGAMSTPGWMTGTLELV